MKPIRYLDYFKQARDARYVSTRQVVDSLLRYEQLINYRMNTQKSNANYYDIANTLDDVFKVHNFYRSLVHNGKDMATGNLITLLNDFSYRVNELQQGRDAAHVFRDTLYLTKIWLNALKRM